MLISMNGEECKMLSVEILKIQWLKAMMCYVSMSELVMLDIMN